MVVAASRGRPVNHIDSTPVRVERAVLAFAGRGEQRHAIGLQPPDRERQRVLRRAIDPVRVVEHDEQRVGLRCGGEQAERRGPDREAVLGIAGPEPERGAQRVCLMLGDLVEMVPQRPAHLEQRRELELCLRLDAEGADDRHPVGLVDRVVEERGLADPRFAADRERAAPTRAGTVEQLVKPQALALTADQHASTLTPEDDRR